jgi:hypothetical protein
MNWKYQDSRRQLVFKRDPDGTFMQMAAFGVPMGETIDPEDAPDADEQAARQYGKLSALAAMTPAQVQAWVQANVTNLAQAQDAIATLAVAVSVLARRI